MANDLYLGHGLHAVVHGQRHGEEQLIVLAAVESCGDDVEVHLLGRHGRLVVERYALLIDAAAHVALVADMQRLAAETVADVNHGRGQNALGGQCLHDVAPRLGAQLALEQVLSSGKVGFEGRQCGRVLPFLSRLAQQLVIDGFLSLEQLQAHVCSPEVAADTDEVVDLRSAACHLLSGFHVAYACDADGQSRERRGSVAANDVASAALACVAHAGIERLQILNAEALG